ncbi:MAG: Ig-like domain-containing protein [Burkholderiaceae bacterium]|nr:Ig-like domain-containing protein [Burkholderiaceae bacterium]
MSTRPASLLLALEPRLMFDGAAAVTAADAATVHVERHAAAEVTTGASSAAHASGAHARAALASKIWAPADHDDGCAPKPVACGPDASTTGPAAGAAAAPVATLQLVASSEGSSVGADVVPGEVLRYRMIVEVPEGTTAGAELRLHLSPGLRFVADGTTTVAFVADGGGIDSSALAGVRLDKVGGGDGVPSVASIVPRERLPGSAIVDSHGVPVPGCTVLPSGEGPRILLGDLENRDRDCGGEFVVVEFDAIVDNAAGAVRGDALPVSFAWHADGGVRAVSDAVTVDVGEPSIVDLDVRVVEVTGTHVVFEATFGNTGDQVAHDVRLVDAFDGRQGVSFGGAWTVSGLPPGAINASTGDTLDLRLPALAPGESVTVRYDGCLGAAGAPVAARDVTVTYTSLSACGGELTVPADGGVATSTTTGERTGDTADYGGVANVYRDVDRVALSMLSGTLWNDTPTPDGAIDAGEARLAGVTVTLTLAGADGALGTRDDVSRTTPTDADGRYAFSAVPAGAARIVAPTPLAAAGGDGGVLRARTDARGEPTDATMGVAVVEGVSIDRLDVGYVQQNRAPTIATPGGELRAVEDVRSAITGVSIADADAVGSGTLSVTLGVDAGRLDVTAAPGVSVVGNGTGSLALAGTLVGLNATLGTLGYTGARDFSGCDTLSIRVDDRGNVGDADGDGQPREPVDDALTATTSIGIAVEPVGDAPIARPDARTTTEGVAITDGQAVVGTPSGDTADTDSDGDRLTVVGVAQGTAAGPVAGGVGTSIVTPLGTLTLQPDGRYGYVPSVDLPEGGIARDVFSYTVADGSGASSTTTITITIVGVGAGGSVSAAPDARSTTEDAPPIAGNAVAGEGVAGGAPGDVRDVDAQGDRLTVVAVDALPASGAPRAGAVGAPVAGTWGTLTLGADGRYTYALAPVAQTLAQGQVVVDQFRYAVTDGTSSATTTLTVTIVGIDDAPTAGSSTQVVDQRQPPGSSGAPVVAPPVADVDDSLDTLRVRVDALERPQAGTFLRPDGTPLAPGAALTVDALQRLTYLPASDYTAPLRVDGTLPGSALMFTVVDPNGGTALGRIDIALRPPTASSSTSIDAPPSGGGTSTPGGPVAGAPGDGGANGGPGEGTSTGGGTGTGTGTGTGLAGPGLPQPAPPPSDASSGPVAVGPGAAPPVVPSTGTPLTGTPGGPTGTGTPGVAVPPADSSTALVAPAPVVASVALTRFGPVDYVPPAAFPPFPQGPAVTLRADPIEPLSQERVGDTVRSARDTSLAEFARLDDDSRRLDLDADGLLPSTRVDGFFGNERIGPLREAAMPGAPAAPVAAAPAASAAPDPGAGAKPVPRASSTDVVGRDDDCVPLPVAKPKPKPVKRILPDGLSKPSGSFTEQIDVQKKKFKPPAKAVPTTPPARQC